MDSLIPAPVYAQIRRPEIIKKSPIVTHAAVKRKSEKRESKKAKKRISEKRKAGKGRERGWALAGERARESGKTGKR